MSGRGAVAVCLGDLMVARNLAVVWGVLLLESDDNHKRLRSVAISMIVVW